jgi:phosphatidate phosphatase APP1
LRSFRLKDRSFLNLFKSSEQSKPPLIKALLTAFPAREFVLIGDSGEIDPEIYGAVARDHPDQVRAILIRNVTGEPAADPRFQAAFADLPTEKWHLFEDAAGAGAFLDRLLSAQP